MKINQKRPGLDLKKKIIKNSNKEICFCFKSVNSSGTERLGSATIDFIFKRHNIVAEEIIG